MKKIVLFLVCGMAGAVRAESNGASFVELKSFTKRNRYMEEGSPDTLMVKIYSAKEGVIGKMVPFFEKAGARKEESADRVIYRLKTPSGDCELDALKKAEIEDPDLAGGFPRTEKVQYLLTFPLLAKDVKQLLVLSRGWFQFWGPLADGLYKGMAASGLRPSSFRDGGKPERYQVEGLSCSSERFGGQDLIHCQILVEPQAL